jgi:Tol biopolymer transport system component
MAVAFTFAPGNSNSKAARLDFVSLETGEVVKEIPVAGDPEIPVAVPGGKSIAYLMRENGVSNIWLQPVDGSPPKQWTHFKLNRQTANFISSYAWSPDGKRIAIAHISVTSDVVLLEDHGH